VLQQKVQQEAGSEGFSEFQYLSIQVFMSGSMCPMETSVAVEVANTAMPAFHKRGMYGTRCSRDPAKEETWIALTLVQWWQRRSCCKGCELQSTCEQPQHLLCRCRLQRTAYQQTLPCHKQSNDFSTAACSPVLRLKPPGSLPRPRRSACRDPPLSRHRSIRQSSRSQNVSRRTF